MADFFRKVWSKFRIFAVVKNNTSDTEHDGFISHFGIGGNRPHLYGHHPGEAAFQRGGNRCFRKGL